MGIKSRYQYKAAISLSWSCPEMGQALPRIDQTVHLVSDPRTNPSN